MITQKIRCSGNSYIVTVPKEEVERLGLAGAVARPQAAAHYEDANIPVQAGVLLLGIALTRPFMDGNKRTAFIVADVFLRRNGYRIVSDHRRLRIAS